MDETTQLMKRSNNECAVTRAITVSKIRPIVFALACAAAWIGPSAAADAPAVQTPVPPEVQALVPAGMKLIFFRADNGRAERSDAIAIIAQAEQSADRNEGNSPRPLIMLRKVHGVYKEEVRNDNIIGCATCGEDHDDPFTPGGIALTPNHLVIEQDHGSASSAVYRFMRDPKSEQWDVVGAVNTVAKPSLGGTVQKTSTAVALPTPPLLANFNPGWQSPQFWNAVATNDATHDFSFLSSQSNEKDLDAHVADACKKTGACHVLVKQRSGCVALVKDHLGIFYAGSANGVSSTSKIQAKSSALDQCAKRGAGQCEAIRSDCAPNSQ